MRLRQKVLKCVWNVFGISIPKALKQEKKFIYAKPSVGAYFSSYELFNFVRLGHLHTARLNRFPYKQISSFEEKFSNFNTFLSFQISLYQCDNYIVENNELSIYQTQNVIKLFIQEIFNRDCNSIQRFLRLDLYTD